MSEIKEKMRVGMIENNKILYGTITTLYDGVSVAIVTLDNGETKKAHFCELAILENIQEEPISEPVANDSITITREDLKQALLEASMPNNLNKLPGSNIMGAQDLLLLSMSGLVVGISLENVLFGEKGEND